MPYAVTNHKLRRAVHCILLSFLLLLSSCEQRPAGVLSKGQMTDVLYDYHLAQSMADWSPTAGNGEQANQPLLDAVFQKHGITEAEFDSSLVYYNAHASDLRDIYEDLKERFTLESQKLQLTIGENQMAALMTENGDTTNLWNGPALIVLRNTPLTNLEKFTISGDSIFRTADHFVLSGDIILLTEERYNHNSRFNAVLSATVRDGKPIGDSYVSQGTSHFSIDIQVPSRQLPTRVSCYFQYQSDDDTRNFCIVRNVALIRMHTHPGDSEPTDSIVADSTAHTPAADSISVADKPTQRHRQPRLSPDQLRLRNQDDEQKIQIRTAPERRTPNSFGPSRRRKP